MSNLKTIESCKTCVSGSVFKVFSSFSVALVKQLLDFLL